MSPIVFVRFGFKACGVEMVTPKAVSMNENSAKAVTSPGPIIL